MYVMVAGQLRSSVTITECLPSIRVLKIADLTNNAHSEALWLTEVIHAQLKISAPWTLFKFTYKRWSISMYFYIHWERERSRDMFSHRLMKTFSWFRRVSHVHRTLNPDFVSLLGANSPFWNIMTSRVACSTCYWNGGLAHRWKSTCCHEANVWPTSQF